MFSKACEYGIRATLYIATQSMKDSRVSLKDIAREIESPPAFTAKILQSLARHGIVESLKGPTGGFTMDTSETRSVRLIEVVTAIDGDAIFNGCGLGLKKCDAQYPCPIHFEFASVRDGLKSMLKETLITDLALGLETGLSFLKR